MEFIVLSTSSPMANSPAVRLLVYGTITGLIAGSFFLGARFQEDFDQSAMNKYGVMPPRVIRAMGAVLGLVSGVLIIAALVLALVT